MLTCRGWSVQWPFALSAVKTGKMPACQRNPYDTMTVDIHTAWRISVNWCARTIERWLIDLSQCCRGRIRPGIHPHDRSRKSQHRSPYRAIDRARSDAVQAGHDPLVFVWIYWFIRFDIIHALSITYRVQNKRR